MSLLKDAADDDADGEEEQGRGNASRGVVVLNPSAAVGAVVSVKTSLSTCSDLRLSSRRLHELNIAPNVLKD